MLLTKTHKSKSTNQLNNAVCRVTLQLHISVTTEVGWSSEVTVTTTESGQYKEVVGRRFQFYLMLCCKTIINILNNKTVKNTICCQLPIMQDTGSAY